VVEFSKSKVDRVLAEIARVRASLSFVKSPSKLYSIHIAFKRKERDANLL
jgi:hypothetical protein